MGSGALVIVVLNRWEIFLELLVVVMGFSFRSLVARRNCLRAIVMY